MLEVLNFGVALATSNSTAVNGTTVLGPALNSLNTFFAQVAEAIPRIIAAGIILLIGFIIGRAVGWFIAKVLEKMNLEDTIGKTGVG